jgi:hypothetical protein
MISVTRWFGEKRLRAIEHDQGSPLSYLRQMLRVSPAHFLTFIKIMPLARFRRALPPEAYHLARIVTARHEHGGTCLQMEIRLAQQAGVRTSAPPCSARRISLRVAAGAGGSLFLCRNGRERKR